MYNNYYYKPLKEILNPEQQRSIDDSRLKDTPFKTFIYAANTGVLIDVEYRKKHMLLNWAIEMEDDETPDGFASRYEALLKRNLDGLVASNSVKHSVYYDDADLPAAYVLKIIMSKTVKLSKNELTKAKTVLSEEWLMHAYVYETDPIDDSCLLDEINMEVLDVAWSNSYYVADTSDAFLIKSKLMSAANEYLNSIRRH